MPDIKELKSLEMQEIIDFFYFIEDYGHIFYDDPQVLDSSFKKIIDGINEVREIIEQNYSI